MSIDAATSSWCWGRRTLPFPRTLPRGRHQRAGPGFLEQYGPEWKDKGEEERQEAMAQFGLSVNIPKMKEDLLRYKIEYDEWFLESALHNSGYVAETVGLLADKGWTYEKDGACGSTPPPCSSRNTSTRARPRSRWTSWT